MKDILSFEECVPCLFSDTLWLEVAIILFFFFIQGGPKKAHIQQYYQQLRLITETVSHPIIEF